jgi:hypothetical protein
LNLRHLTRVVQEAEAEARKLDSKREFKRQVLELPPTCHHCLPPAITASHLPSLPPTCHHCLPPAITASHLPSLPPTCHHCLPPAIAAHLTLESLARSKRIWMRFVPNLTPVRCILLTSAHKYLTFAHKNLTLSLTLVPNAQSLYLLRTISSHIVCRVSRGAAREKGSNDVLCATTGREVQFHLPAAASHSLSFSLNLSHSLSLSLSLSLQPRDARARRTRW